jgi:sporulation protein YlmC with PRC-barrel domain
VSTHQSTTGTELQKLADTGLTLDDARQDIRGRKIIDQRGEAIGHVSNLFIDAGERKVRMLEVRAGGFLGLGDKHFLLPVDAVTRVEADAVHVNETRERIVHSPVYNPQLVEAPTREYWEPFYGYYGLSPYWGNGYLYPGFPLSLEERPVVNEHSSHAQDL